MRVVETLLEGGKNPILLLLVQVALILGLSRLIGVLFARIRQPQVVGEMLAGIMLGPSLFGLLFPHAWALVFPASTIFYLNILSQIGVIYFLFLVGLELNPRLLRNRGHTAVVISHVSILAPFLLGAVLTIFLYTRLFNHAPHMQFRSVALFLGASMSITAFPVLARILTERNLHKSRVGAVTITCAAVDDVTAWCMLAFVIGIARAQGLRSGLITAGLALVYVVVMFFLVRPFLRRLQYVYERQQRLSQHLVGLTFLLVLVSAYITEVIGIHALFGAFVLGAIMPKGSAFVHAITEKLEDFTVILLLPIFFAYTGLNMHINSIDSAEMWFYCGLIIFVACLGKFGGSTLAARLCGFGWREAGAVGILMNTRGLMELVILNIGRELGVITDAVFAMMVIMALVTTALTTPILHLVFPKEQMQQEESADAAGGYSVLIPVAMPSSGGPLVQLADALTGDDDPDRRIFALYLKRPVDQDAYRVSVEDEPVERIGELQPLLEQARKGEIPVTPVSFTSRDVASDIARTARLRNVDLILMGFHNPVYTASILGGTVHRVLTGSDADVAIYVDRSQTNLFPEPDPIQEKSPAEAEAATAQETEDGTSAPCHDPARPPRVLVPYLGSKHDRLALELAGRMARNKGVSVTVLHVVAPAESRGEHQVNAKAATDRVFGDPTQPLPVTLRTIEGHSPVDVVIEQSKDFDLIVIGVAEEWGLESQLFGFRAERIAREVASSLLIVRKHGRHRAARGVMEEEPTKPGVESKVSA